MNSRTYFRYVQEAVLAAPHVIQSNLAFDEISENECYVRGSLSLSGGFELHVAEYVVTEPELIGSSPAFSQLRLDKLTIRMLPRDGSGEKEGHIDKLAFS